MEAERDPRENPAVELADRLGLPQPGLFATMDEVIEDVRLRLDVLTTRLRAAEAVVEAAQRLDWEKVAKCIDVFDLFLEKFTASEPGVASKMERIRVNTEKCPPGDLMQTRIREFAAVLAALDTLDKP